MDNEEIGLSKDEAAALANGHFESMVASCLAADGMRDLKQARVFACCDLMLAALQGACDTPQEFSYAIETVTLAFFALKLHEEKAEDANAPDAAVST